MLTVALIGPDGCGKTTLAASLPERLPVPAVALYMGTNPDAAHVRSPLARAITAVQRRMHTQHHDAGPPDRPQVRGEGGSAPARPPVKATLRSVARAANLVMDHVYRGVVVARHRRAGRVVILDRDVWADYWAHDVRAPADLGRWLHGRYLTHCYRKPDLHVYLDAPAEVLFARKGEGTVERLQARQDDYRALAPLAPRFETVDAARPPDVVLDDVVALVSNVIAARTAGPTS